jgi:cysteinyl-tRNA synthetase
VSEQLVIDLARELYDRFVMGGWEPQDAYPQIRAMLSGEAPAQAAQSKLTTFRCDCGLNLLVEGQVVGKEFRASAAQAAQEEKNALIEKWFQAKRERRFEESDKIRQKLIDLNVDVQKVQNERLGPLKK